MVVELDGANWMTINAGRVWLRIQGLRHSRDCTGHRCSASHPGIYSLSSISIKFSPHDIGGAESSGTTRKPRAARVPLRGSPRGPSSPAAQRKFQDEAQSPNLSPRLRGACVPSAGRVPQLQPFPDVSFPPRTPPRCAEATSIRAGPKPPHAGPGPSPTEQAPCACTSCRVPTDLCYRAGSLCMCDPFQSRCPASCLGPALDSRPSAPSAPRPCSLFVPCPLPLSPTFACIFIAPPSFAAYCPSPAARLRPSPSLRGSLGARRAMPSPFLCKFKF